MTGRECALIVAAVRQRGSSSAGVQNDRNSPYPNSRVA